eukprot:scaffold9150_cov120-Isochrysis_galbana.AAC.15
MRLSLSAAWYSRACAVVLRVSAKRHGGNLPWICAQGTAHRPSPRRSLGAAQSQLPLGLSSARPIDRRIHAFLGTPAIKARPRDSPASEGPSQPRWCTNAAGRKADQAGLRPALAASASFAMRVAHVAGPWPRPGATTRDGPAGAQPVQVAGGAVPEGVMTAEAMT